MCEAGADLLNDAWGGVGPASWRRSPPGTARAWCARTRAAPSRAPVRTGSAYDDVMADILRAHGRRWRSGRRRWASRGTAILIDPGHDFGKNTRHSLEATRRLTEMTATGWPVLVSLSNKDFVGETLDRPVKERLIGTLADDRGVGVARGAGVPGARGGRDPAGAGHGGVDPGHRPPAVARRGLA